MRFEIASGAKLRPEDADVIGPELMRIAETNKIGDLRVLNKEIVLEEVLANPNSPLRQYYNWDVNSAARAHWLERSQQLINSIRIVEANVFPVKPRKLFVSKVDLAQLREDGTSIHRGLRVVAPDAACHDDIYVRILEDKISRIKQALRNAENWAERNTVPDRHRILLQNLHGLLESF